MDPVLLLKRLHSNKIYKQSR